MVDTFIIWLGAVLRRFEETQQNQYVLTFWADAESPPMDKMRWNNPLNCTQKEPGSRNSGAQPGNNDVQIYRSVQSGIDATIGTLFNGHYPNILRGLANSEPPAWYLENASRDFDTWGTGTAWLHHVPTVDNPGPIITEDEMLACFVARIVGGGEAVFVTNGVHYRHVINPSQMTDVDNVGAWINGKAVPMWANATPVNDPGAFGVPANAETAKLIGVPYP